MTSIRQATSIWLLLISATIIAAFLGAIEFDGIGKTGMWVTTGSVLILIIKGQLVVDHFMALRDVQPLWRLLFSAYCLVIGLFIILAYYLGLS